MNQDNDNFLINPNNLSPLIKKYQKKHCSEEEEYDMSKLLSSFINQDDNKFIFKKYVLSILHK